MLSWQGCYVEKECLCVDIYEPVCGENGQTYQNSCAAACDDVRYVEGECPVNGVGKVKYSGDSLCGFLISIYGENYKPDTLAPVFREDGLWLNLRYRKLNNFTACDDPYTHLQVIQILDIKKIK